MNQANGMRSMGLAAVLGIFAAAGSAGAQTAKLHGHVNDPAGSIFKGGEVKLTLDKSANANKEYKFNFPIDNNGDYKAENVAPGDYLAIVYKDSKTADFQVVELKAADDKVLNFDMTREEYLKAMTPEARAALEDFKKKNAATTADNAKIGNINKTLLAAREDEKNGKLPEALQSLQGLTQAKPDEPILWASLGEAQLMTGDTAAKAARAAKTPVTEEITKNFTEAAASYQKAIDLNAAASKKTTPENLAAYYLNLGQSLSKSGKLSEASQAYDMSAKTNPAAAASAYYNEAVIFYSANPQKLTEAGAAADKAIAADPKRADAYYIKAQALIPAATADPKTGKFILPPGCLEAYQEYLDLAPTGAHATEVKELLTNLGQPVKNSFKAGKK